jgi:hypothetical protein
LLWHWQPAPALKGRKVLLALPVPPVPKAPKVLLALKALPVPKVLLVLPVPLVLQVKGQWPQRT